MNYKKLFVIMSVTMIVSTIALFFFWLPHMGKNVLGAENNGVINIDLNKCSVVLDAGHGGIDPGKKGINGCLEKDINLDIAKRLESMLQLQGVSVTMTRTDDEGLYSESDANKKRADLKKRCELINKTAPDVAVSIHQNSYSSQSAKGAQVFYYEMSAQGRELAEILQAKLTEYADNSNRRGAKADDEYYLLINTEVPAVIVECGFLSNSAEAELLCTDEYKDKITYAIYMGILEYIFTMNFNCGG